jgi:hypothetical protein
MRLDKEERDLALLFDQRGQHRHRYHPLMSPLMSM